MYQSDGDYISLRCILSFYVTSSAILNLINVHFDSSMTIIY